MARLFQRTTLFAPFLAIAFLVSAACGADPPERSTADKLDDDALARRVVELESQLATMQQAMDAMRQQLETLSQSRSSPMASTPESSVEPVMVTGQTMPLPPSASGGAAFEQEIDRRIDAYLNRMEQQPRSPSVWDRLEHDLRVYGQVRVRQETDFERIEAPTRNRQRLRTRLGVDYVVDPEWKIGARITTGDRKSSLEPLDRGGAPLSYQDTGDVFDKFEINLDRLFATYSPEWCPGAWLSVGKFKHPIRLNPIFDSPVGDLAWDEAAHPEGIASGYAMTNWCGFSKIELIAGESAVLELSNFDDSSLFFTQVWAERTLGCWTLGGGVAFYNWENLNPDAHTTLSFQNNSGNAVIVVGPDPEDVVFASGFKILNPLLTLTFDDKEPCSGWYPVQLVYETFYNFDSFATDRDFGYTVGAAYGPAVVSQNRGDWYVYYAWVDVQQESVFTAVAQDDFLRATSFRGHMFGVAWMVREHIELRLSFLTDTPLDPIAGSDETEWRGRLDLTVNF